MHKAAAKTDASNGEDRYAPGVLRPRNYAAPPKERATSMITFRRMREVTSADMRFASQYYTGYLAPSNLWDNEMGKAASFDTGLP